jgi:hypothetical protein
MLMQVIKYSVGGFKQAQSIEGSIDLATKELEQKAVKAASKAVR